MQTLTIRDVFTWGNSRGLLEWKPASICWFTEEKQWQEKQRWQYTHGLWRHMSACHHGQHQLGPDSDAESPHMKRTNQQISFVLIVRQVWPVVCNSFFYHHCHLWLKHKSNIQVNKNKSLSFNHILMMILYNDYIYIYDDIFHLLLTRPADSFIDLWISSPCVMWNNVMIVFIMCHYSIKNSHWCHFIG